MKLTNETWQERLRDLESEIYHRFVDHISKQVKKLIDHPLLQSLLCTGISPCECQLWILQPGTKTIKILQCATENGYFWDTENVKQMGSKNLKTVFCCFESYLSPGFVSFSFPPSLKEIITSRVSASATSGLVPYLHSYMTHSYGRVLGFHLTFK